MKVTTTATFMSQNSVSTISPADGWYLNLLNSGLGECFQIMLAALVSGSWWYTQVRSTIIFSCKSPSLLRKLAICLQEMSNIWALCCTDSSFRSRLLHTVQKFRLSCDLVNAEPRLTCKVLANLSPVIFLLFIAMPSIDFKLCSIFDVDCLPNLPSSHQEVIPSLKSCLAINNFTCIWWRNLAGLKLSANKKQITAFNFSLVRSTLEMPHLMVCYALTTKSYTILFKLLRVTRFVEMLQTLIQP